MLVLSGHKGVMKVIVSERAICMKNDDQKEYIIAYSDRRLLEAKKIGMCLLNSNACNIFALISF
jgi:hypothetical protein